MTAKDHVWVVDDDRSIRWVLERALEQAGMAVTLFESASAALHRLRTERPDAILSDIRMPGIDGLELLQQLRERDAELPVLLITGHGDVPLAVQAMRAGAYDFLEKPFANDDLLDSVRRALELRRLVLDNRSLRMALTDRQQLASRLVGQSAAMHRLREQIGALAGIATDVLILGETGAGKEVVARNLHYHSKRREAPFVPVNCGAIPAELLESELFGHEKGAFTGAITSRAGRFELANGGTLFLDEIGDMPLPMQVKLLRAIQEKAVRAVGGQQEVAVDVRILCATHKDLAAEVAAGRFRQDLYYRLNVIELRVPSLRERREDIAQLAEVMLARLAEGSGLAAAKLQPDALEKLKNYRFPGNVRELENMLERAYTLCEDDQIRPSDLRLADTSAPTGEVGEACLAQIDNLEDYLEEIERKLIMQALEETRWNRTAAAERLGLTFRSMRYRLKKLGLDD